MGVLLPATFREACTMRASEPEVVPLAGGTDLLANWPARPDAHRRTYLDLSKLSELRTISWEDDALVLGAGTTFWDVRRDAAVARELPLLARVAGCVGTLQIQTRGTWAGNVVTGSRFADAAAVLLALDAELELVAETSPRRLPLADSIGEVGPVLRSARALARAIRVPRRRYGRAVFEKLGLRAANTRAVLNLTVLESDGRFRIVVGGAAPRVTRCVNLEERIASGHPVDSPDELIPAIRRDLDDPDAEPGAVAYRERALARILATTLSETAPWIRGNL